MVCLHLLSEGPLIETEHIQACPNDRELLLRDALGLGYRRSIQLHW
jgi:hypothetical protein